MASTTTCNIVRLATETLHQICAQLQTDDDYEALANLRLSCRTFRLIPEAYLFSRVHLDRRISSLSYVQNVSQHPRLRNYVKTVHLELGPTLPELDEQQWHHQVSKYPRATKPSCSNMRKHETTGNYLRQLRLLAEERDRMSPDEMQQARAAYELVLKEQKELDSYSAHQLTAVLTPALSSFQNLTRFMCTGCDQAKIAAAPPVGKHLRRSVQQTLTLPEDSLNWYDIGGRRILVDYVIACLVPLMKSTARLAHIGLKPIPIEVLGQLKKILDEPRNQHGLMNLETLILQLHIPIYTREPFDAFTVADALSTVITAAPRLSSLKLCNWAHLPYPCPTAFGSLYIGLPPLANRWLLRCVDLVGIQFIRRELRGILGSMSSTLRSLSLTHIEVAYGYWIDVFDDMRSILSLDEFSFIALLEENLIHGVRMTWWTSDTGSGTLKDEVTAYVLKTTDKKRWKTIEEGGTPLDWEAMGDQSMWYEIEEFGW